VSRLLPQLRADAAASRPPPPGAHGAV